MKNYLEQGLLINKELAVKLGLTNAVVFAHLKHLYELNGKEYLRIKTEELHKGIPFVSLATVRRAIRLFRDEGMIKTITEGEHPMDRILSFKVLI